MGPLSSPLAASTPAAPSSSASASTASSSVRHALSPSPENVKWDKESESVDDDDVLPDLVEEEMPSLADATGLHLRQSYLYYFLFFLLALWLFLVYSCQHSTTPRVATKDRLPIGARPCVKEFYRYAA